jgi:hypothetical protein
MTFVREDIPFEECSALRAGSSDDYLEALAVRVRIGRRHGEETLTVVNLYDPPGRLVDPGSGVAGFDPSILQVSHRHIWCGDVNCHSFLWDPIQPEDRQGERLEDWMAPEGLGCLNDGTATRRNPATGGSSTPDLTVVHCSWLGRAEWSCLDEMASDHLPILVEMELQVECLSARSDRLRWDWASADWAAYREAVDRLIGQSPLVGDDTAPLTAGHLAVREYPICSESTCGDG